MVFRGIFQRLKYQAHIGWQFGTQKRFVHGDIFDFSIYPNLESLCQRCRHKHMLGSVVFGQSHTMRCKQRC